MRARNKLSGNRVDNETSLGVVRNLSEARRKIDDFISAITEFKDVLEAGKLDPSSYAAESDRSGFGLNRMYYYGCWYYGMWLGLLLRLLLWLDAGYKA